MAASNDTLTLVPVTSITGRTLHLDYPDLKIGIAEYPDGPTGCTVFDFGRPRPCSIDVRGGSPGLFGDYGMVEAICFAGGSLYGLEAAVGVQAELLARRDYRVGWGGIALVSGAIIYDFRPRENSIYPDKALGRAALRAARPGRFPLGAQGAGRSATVGKMSPSLRYEPSGQGGAFRQIGDVTLAFFTVVNAVGAIVDREGTVVRGNLDPATGRRISSVEAAERELAAGDGETAGGNTTISLLLTNAQLAPPESRQLGRQVHSSMARAIQPFHAINDGDILFTVTTEETKDSGLGVTPLGVLASEVAWDAVLSSWTS